MIHAIGPALVALASLPDAGPCAEPLLVALHLCQECGAEPLLGTKVITSASVGQAAQLPAVLRLRTRSRHEQGERIKSAQRHRRAAAVGVLLSGHVLDESVNNKIQQ
eukprot:scaffold115263_cov69-Phaeocystis_antarctica.AAC.4